MSCASLCRRLLIAACLALAALPAAASAAAWQDLPQLSSGPGGQAEGVKIAFTPAGDAIAVWRRLGTDYRSNVEASTRPAGGEWSAPRVLTVSQLDRHIFYPDIAMDGDGNALITWTRDEAKYGPQRVQAVEKPVDGDFGAVETLPHTGGVGVGGSSAPSIVFDDAGTATAVFSYDGSGTPPMAVIRVLTKPRGGSWSAPTDITADTVPSYYPKAGIDTAGDLTVVWREGYVGQPQRVLAKTLPAGGAWPADPDVLSTVAHDNGGAPALAVTPEGKAVAAWTQYAPGGFHVHTAARNAGETAWTTTDVTEDGEQANDPTLGADDAGRVTLAWRRTTPGSYANPSFSEVRVADFAGSAAEPGTPVAVSGQRSSIFAAKLAVAPDGTSTVVWRDSGDGFAVLRGARRDGDGWTPEEDVTDTSEGGGYYVDHAVTHDPGGNVLVSYGRSTRLTTYAAHASVFDRTAPALSHVAIPATAVAGEPVWLAALASDDWSDAETHWTFADATATGSPVERAFDAGTHAVSVRAVDAAGNASAPVEQTISVPAPESEEEQSTDTGSTQTGGGSTQDAGEQRPTVPVPVPPLLGQPDPMAGLTLLSGGRLAMGIDAVGDGEGVRVTRDGVTERRLFNPNAYRIDVRETWRPAGASAARAAKAPGAVARSSVRLEPGAAKTAALELTRRGRRLARKTGRLEVVRAVRVFGDGEMTVSRETLVVYAPRFGYRHVQTRGGRAGESYNVRRHANGKAYRHYADGDVTLRR